MVKFTSIALTAIFLTFVPMQPAGAGCPANQMSAYTSSSQFIMSASTSITGGYATANTIYYTGDGNPHYILKQTWYVQNGIKTPVTYQGSNVLAWSAPIGRPECDTWYIVDGDGIYSQMTSAYEPWAVAMVIEN